MTDGFLNLLKPPGITSSDAVVLVRRAFPRGTKVGHMGTLDPEAAGVLPIGVGSAARLFDYVTEKEKTYRAEIAIGAETDTQDATGQVVARGPAVTEEELRAVLPRFVGEIEQIPPAYSAIKVGGRKLYEAARAGETLEVPSRKVTIYGLDFAGKSGENRFLLDVRCGRGTYIRTLCQDIGRALGTCSHMAFLLRVQSGIFGIADAVTPEEFLESAPDAHLLPLDAPLRHLPAVHLSEKLERVVRNGNPIRMEGWKHPLPEGKIARVYLGEAFAGMGEAKEGCIRFRCMLLR